MRLLRLMGLVLVVSRCLGRCVVVRVVSSVSLAIFVGLMRVVLGLIGGCCFRLVLVGGLSCLLMLFSVSVTGCVLVVFWVMRGRLVCLWLSILCLVARWIWLVGVRVGCSRGVFLCGMCRGLRIMWCWIRLSCRVSFSLS